MLHAGLVLLQTHDWDAPLVERFTKVIRGKDGPLTSNNVHVPESITYHVCDIFLDELEGVVQDEEGSVPMLALLIPFIELAATSHSKRVHERVMGSVITPFLDSMKEMQGGKKHSYPVLLEHAAAPTEDDDDDDEEENVDDEPNRLMSLRRSILKAAFTIASGPDTYAPSRRKLYALWQAEEHQ